MLKVDGEYVSLEDGAVDRWLKDRVSEQVVNVLRQSQRAFYSYLAKGRAVYLSPDLLASRTLQSSQTDAGYRTESDGA